MTGFLNQSLIGMGYKNTNRDGGSTALKTAYTVDSVNTVDMAYTVDTVDPVDTV